MAVGFPTPQAGARPGRRLGRIARRSALLLAAVGAGFLALQRLQRPSVLVGPGFRVEVVDRARTGHQRAERLVFLDGGRRLAVTCPRYNRVAQYRVLDGRRLQRQPDLKLGGRPVALGVVGDRLIVLQRPAGDARHVEEAWWDVYDPQGRPVGSKFRVGFDPDDLAVLPDGRTALVLLSGSAEGESNRPAPSLLVLEISDLAHPRPIAELAFDRPGDDPERLAYGPANGMVTASLHDSNEVIRIDLSRPQAPRILERRPLAPGEEHLLSGGQAGSVEFGIGGGASRRIELDARAITLDVLDGRRRVARLPLSGFNEFRPMELAAQSLGADGLLAAVSDRSGGVCLVRVDRTTPE
jgi:glycerol-3-phosphate acyltransferase PlsY